MQIFFDSQVEPAPTVFDGAPPVDQSALVAQLQGDLAAANSKVAQLEAKIAAAVLKAQADKDADNANVAGQGVLDALA